MPDREWCQQKLLVPHQNRPKDLHKWPNKMEHCSDRTIPSASHSMTLPSRDAVASVADGWWYANPSIAFLCLPATKSHMGAQV